MRSSFNADTLFFRYAELSSLLQSATEKAIIYKDAEVTQPVWVPFILSWDPDLAPAGHVVYPGLRIRI